MAGAGPTRDSTASHARRATRGTSLIELLVVVAIIAVLAAAVTLSVDLAGAPRLVEREARRLEALVELACERAQMSGHDYGLHLGSARYAFSVFVPTGWKLETLADLRPRDLPKGLVLSARREGLAMELEDAVPAEPQVVCFASGELSPFDAEISAGEALHALHGLPDGSVSVEVVP